jgi:DNA-binding transcriptional MerR regulator
MAEWRIKEMSDMTKTSIRMLRYYDKMGLLKPSHRAANGYRYYTAEDLAKLQQIIALRYFGFNLGTIKTILQKHQNIYAHLQAQQQVLKEQSVHLQQVNSALQDILKHLAPSQVPDWNDLIILIERYRMTENLRDKLKKTWARELSEAQFEEYLWIYEQFPEEFAKRDKIIEQINNKELGDPTGPDGERIATFFHELAIKMKKIFSKQIKLSSSLLQSMRSGKLSQLPVTPEGAMWLSKATLTFWLKRWNALYEAILANLQSDPESKVGKKIAKEWTGLVDEYFLKGPHYFFTGILLWQECARQEHELKESTVTLSPKEMVKPYHVKLLFNPEAASWISRALEVHGE